MLIVMILWTLVCFTIGGILCVKYEPYPYIGIVVICCALFVIPFPANIGTPPTQDFPYQASVTLPNATQPSDIYFYMYHQDGENSDRLVINKYATRALHWTDFRGYDVITKPLYIYLKDNDNKFIFTDREYNITFNGDNAIDPDIATQP